SAISRSWSDGSGSSLEHYEALFAGLLPVSLDRWGREFKRPVFGGRPHAERRMGRLAVVVLEPLAELREDDLRIAELGAVDIVAFERVHERLGEAIALGAIRWRRDRLSLLKTRLSQRSCVVRSDR